MLRPFFFPIGNNDRGAKDESTKDALVRIELVSKQVDCRARFAGAGIEEQAKTREVFGSLDDF